MTCNQCPRKCGSHINLYNDLELIKSDHYCQKPRHTGSLVLAKAMVHFWEEPCISGLNGSGGVFLSGCNLGCYFCQNHEISNSKDQIGTQLDCDEMEKVLFKLKEQGCHNINFVTGSHYINELASIMKSSSKNGLDLPFVWNSSAYETKFQINTLQDCVDIYLPDLKFFSQELSSKVANASDYFEVASKAIIEIIKQKPVNKYCDYAVDVNKYTADVNKDYIDHVNKDDIVDVNKKVTNTSKIQLLKEGVIIRHLVLPGFHQDSIKILEWIEANLSNSVTLSLLSQYIPDFYETGCKLNGGVIIPSLTRKLTTFEYEKVVNKAISLGFKDVYTQKKESASREYVPIFKDDKPQ